jgi:hypothetical protein
LGDIRYVYRDGQDCFDQVLLSTGRFNALLAIVIDLKEKAIFGHFLLDLNEEYDVRGGRQKPV